MDIRLKEREFNAKRLASSGSPSFTLKLMDVPGDKVTKDEKQQKSTLELDSSGASTSERKSLAHDEIVVVLLRVVLRWLEVGVSY